MVAHSPVLDFEIKLEFRLDLVFDSDINSHWCSCLLSLLRGELFIKFFGHESLLGGSFGDVGKFFLEVKVVVLLLGKLWLLVRFVNDVGGRL